MFESFVTGQKRSRPKAKITLLLSLAVHVTAALAVLAVSFWQIEKVPGTGPVITFDPGVSTLMAAPAAPAAAAAPARKKSRRRADKSVKTQRTLRPATTQPIDEPPTSDDDDLDDDDPLDGDDDDGGTLDGVIDGDRFGKPGGVAGGDPDGVVGGDRNGSGGGGGGQPKLVPEKLLRGRRIAGEDNIYLPDAVAQALFARDVRRIAVTAKMCISRHGVPTTVEFLRSTGYPRADRKLAAGLRKWRYQPFRVRGHSVPVCTVVVLDYTLIR